MIDEPAEIDPEELYNRAIKLYFHKYGTQVMAPNRGLSQVIGDRVVLKNLNGELASFVWCGKRLKEDLD